MHLHFIILFDVRSAKIKRTESYHSFIINEVDVKSWQSWWL